ncbi:methyl-accepting chemotaxis protein [Desulfobacter latus]|uniref:Cache domain-containing protein n=1 Tax=Desulfobacter latus TaxID=2292 RepID=A0A850TD86_9BACT|nr:methyl-accepting chemotaxis protein [Desulfobacter latus]NWH06237.1 cache domain-containing protein [Desulfobacter latus]
MNWKNIKIKNKIGIGIGTVVFLLGIMSIISYFGVEGIVVDAREVISGNKLYGTLAQKEVEHLNWVADVSRFFTDESLTSLDVKTDGRSCGLGKWLYSDDRKKAQALIPGLAPLFKAIEAPHRELHESVSAIKNTLKKDHGDLAQVLSNHLAGIINWVVELNKAVAEEAGGMYTYQNLLKAASGKATDLIQSIRSIDMPDLNQKQAVLNSLKHMRFGSIEEDYFFVLDANGVVVMHPLEPSLVGKKLSDTEDKNGRKPFDAMRQAPFNDGEGFVSFDHSLFDGLRPAPMLVFATKYSYWDWVICACLHVDAGNQKLMDRANDVSQGKPFKLNIELNADQSNFGKFLSAPETSAIMSSFPELESILPQLADAHKKLFRNAWEIETAINDMNMTWAMNVLVNKIRSSLAEVHNLFQQAINAETQLTQSRVKAQKIFTTRTIPAVGQIKSTMADIQKEIRQAVLTDEQMLSHAWTVRNRVLVMGIAAILIGIGLTFIISRSISRPVIQGVAFAETIAGKDLTKRLDINQTDEVGLLASALNNMSENLQLIFSDIVAGVGTLTSSSIQLSDVSRQIAENAGQTSLKTGHVSTSAETMSDNMNSVASASEQATMNLQMIATAIEEMAATTQEVAHNTEKGNETTSKAVATAKEVSAKVNELDRAAEEISKVTETIAEISEQTNLLALNATIEASRAGESGKGFAVVAAEIKELARQTAHATQDINGRISAIQTTATESAGAINTIVNVINEINQIVTTIASAIEEQTATTRQISKNVSDAAIELDEVNSNIKQVSVASKEVTQNITDVNQATESVESGSHDIRTSAESLSRLAGELHEIVSHFTIGESDPASHASDPVSHESSSAKSAA